MSKGHDIDLDWEKEADRYYMYQLEQEEETKAQYYAWLDKQRKPAKITILTPIKNEVSNDTLSF